MTTVFAPQTWIGTLRVSSPFGAVDDAHKAPHSGTDIITAGPCLAPFDGIVTRPISAGASGGLGDYFQMVSHDGRFVFTVGHGNKNSDTGLAKGSNVPAGAHILADMGRPTTGSSTGPHYHEQLTDNGRLVDILDYLGQTWGAEVKPAPVLGGWDGVSTLYKGNYADDGMVYTIHVGETIWGVATSKGLTLAQVHAWTAALAGSKYGPAQLAKSGPGASWWDGGNEYYAGATFAVADVVAKFVAEDIAVAEAQQAAAEQSDEAATDAVAASSVLAVPISTESNTEYAAADARVQLAAQAKADAQAELDAAIARAKATLPDIDTDTKTALDGSETANTRTPLAGLLAEHPAARKRTYYAYAASALIVSFGPDIVTAGILADSSIPAFVAYVSLASSILLKIGVAFGFVAASNVSK